MHIAMCGSIAFYKEMQTLKGQLEEMGHTVSIPPKEITDNEGKPISVESYYELRQDATDKPDSWIWKRKKTLLLDYFDVIKESDAILVANYEKKGVSGYIGGNTLMEMGIAGYLKKPMYLLFDIPELSYKEEILALNPTLLDGSLNQLASESL